MATESPQPPILEFSTTQILATVGNVQVPNTFTNKEIFSATFYKDSWEIHVRPSGLHIKAGDLAPVRNWLNENIPSYTEYVRWVCSETSAVFEWDTIGQFIENFARAFDRVVVRYKFSTSISHSTLTSPNILDEIYNLNIQRLSCITHASYWCMAQIHTKILGHLLSQFGTPVKICEIYFDTSQFYITLYPRQTNVEEILENWLENWLDNLHDKLLEKGGKIHVHDMGYGVRTYLEGNNWPLVREYAKKLEKYVTWKFENRKNGSVLGLDMLVHKVLHTHSNVKRAIQ